MEANDGKGDNGSQQIPADTAMTTAESIRKLLLAHYGGDDARFRATAEDFIEAARGRNHHHLAKDLETILSAHNGTTPPNGHRQKPQVLAPLRRDIGTPQDSERGVDLVEPRDARRGLDTLVLDHDTRVNLERIIEENRRAEVLRAHGLAPSSRILFCGPPGCGKTASAEAVAAQLSLPLALVRFDAVVSSYLGETASNLRKVFDFARSRPMVILFDEFDAIGKDRASAEEHGEIKRVVNSFLQILDGFPSDTVTIAATNHEGLLDQALWRRFDEIIVFAKPDEAAIAELLANTLRQIGVEPGVRFDALASEMRGFSHADVERVCLDAMRNAILADQPRVGHAALETSLRRQRVRSAVAARDRLHQGSPNAEGNA